MRQIVASIAVVLCAAQLTLLLMTDGYADGEVEVLQVHVFSKSFFQDLSRTLSLAECIKWPCYSRCAGFV